MRFKEFFLKEDKPIYHKSKEIWLDYLEEKYKKNSKDLYVSFVSEDKIGINPKSKWDTPIGVYTYPLTWVLEYNKIPFRGTSIPTKIKVLKLTSDKILSDDITKEEYTEAYEKIKKLYEKDNTFIDKKTFDDFYLDTTKKAKVQSRFGFIWNLTRVLSDSPAHWSKILMSLGFDVAIDDGNGVIHHNEPTQTVFLSPKSYKVVDEEFISTGTRYLKTNKKSVVEIKDIINLLNINKQNDEELNKLFKKYKEEMNIISERYPLFDSLDSEKLKKKYLETCEKGIKYYLKHIGGNPYRIYGNFKIENNVELIKKAYKTFEKEFYNFYSKSGEDLSLLEHLSYFLRKLDEKDAKEIYKPFEPLLEKAIEKRNGELRSDFSEIEESYPEIFDKVLRSIKK